MRKWISGLLAGLLIVIVSAGCGKAPAVSAPPDSSEGDLADRIGGKHHTAADEQREPQPPHREKRSDQGRDPSGGGHDREQLHLPSPARHRQGRPVCRGGDRGGDHPDSGLVCQCGTHPGPTRPGPVGALPVCDHCAGHGHRVCPCRGQYPCLGYPEKDQDRQHQRPLLRRQHLLAGRTAEKEQGSGIQHDDQRGQDESPYGQAENRVDSHPAGTLWFWGQSRERRGRQSAGECQ